VGGVRGSDPGIADTIGMESFDLAKPDERRDGMPVPLRDATGDIGVTATGEGGPATSGNGRRGGLSPLTRCWGKAGPGLRGARGELTVTVPPPPPPTKSEETPPFFQVAFDGRGDEPLLRDAATRSGALGAIPSV
jgi:hypothetical protein